MRSVMKTIGGGALGFVVGAGSVGSGVAAYHLWAVAHANTAGALSQYAAVAKITPSTIPLGTNTVSNVVKSVGPAVVKIITKVPASPKTSAGGFGSFFGAAVPQTVETGIGSGFFFNAQGDILTNDHVIQGATQIQVQVPGYQQLFSATVVGSDYATDLAVIKIHPPKPMPYLQLGDSNDTPVGAWVVAIGNPYNLNHTVTVGVLSAKGRPLTIGQRNYRNLIQTSAAINPGNSGGPLLNLDGQVIGINTAVQTNAQGIGFAIPTSTVSQILPLLMRYGHVERPWMGVFVQTDTPTVAQEYSLPTPLGVVITGVEPGSPAQKAGLSAGDIITAADAKSAWNVAALQAVIAGSKVGQRLTLRVDENGKNRVVSVVLGQQPNGPIALPSGAGPNVN